MESTDPKLSINPAPSLRSQTYVPTTQLLQLTNFNSTQLSDALRTLSNQLGIGASAARKILEWMATTGKIASYADFKVLMSDEGQLLAQARVNQAPRPDEFKARPIVNTANEEIIANRNTTNIYRASLNKDIQGDFAPRPTKTAAEKPEAIPLERQILSQLITSPKAFASWLVNNRTAFIILRTDPALAYTLAALANPRVQMSPLMLAELAKLLAQMIKLKQGKSVTESVDDVAAEDREQDVLLAENDRGTSVVGGVRNAVSGSPVAPLKDFLLEAERFAEEEIANLWSLTLRKEKEVGQEVMARFAKLQSRRKK